MQDPIDLAAYHLANLYRHIAFPLTQALKFQGVNLTHSCPRTTPGQPYDVTGDAPLTAMRDKVVATGQLWVSSDFCADTIYETAADNQWFRFIHDMGHLLYGCEFDSAGEAELHKRLWQWLETCPSFWALTTEEQRWVKAVYLADTQGQTDYFDEHGEFPKYQRIVVRQLAEVYYAQA